MKQLSEKQCVAIFAELLPGMQHNAFEARQRCGLWIDQDDIIQVGYEEAYKVLRTRWDPLLCKGGRAGAIQFLQQVVGYRIHDYVMYEAGKRRMPGNKRNYKSGRVIFDHQTRTTLADDTRLRKRPTQRFDWQLCAIQALYDPITQPDAGLYKDTRIMQAMKDLYLERGQEAAAVWHSIVEEKTLGEIGRLMHVTESRASQLRQVGLDTLRKILVTRFHITNSNLN